MLCQWMILFKMIGYLLELWFSVSVTIMLFQNIGECHLKHSIESALELIYLKYSQFSTV